MTILTGDSYLKGFSGTIGGLEFRQLGGKTLTFVSPRYSKRPAEQRHAIDKSVIEAYSAAHRAVLDSEAVKTYTSGITHRKKNAFVVALFDKLFRPKIHSIDVCEYNGASYSEIRVKARDDFKVKSVLIKISTISGKVVEVGEARLLHGQREYWDYRSKAKISSMFAAQVTVVVCDFAGNYRKRSVLVPRWRLSDDNKKKHSVEGIKNHENKGNSESKVQDSQS